ncbi:MAG: hypothetical protein ACRERC_15550 [Candidatus Binatia bacterium]
MAKLERVGRRDQAAALLLLALLIGLAVAVFFRRSMIEDVPPPTRQARLQHDAVLFDRFSARRERTEAGDTLSVSLRLRTSASVSLPSYVFVVARNDQVTPKLWAIWPPQEPGAAITASGHFHGATPTSGYAVTLTDTWERVTATIPHPARETFDTVAVYVVDPDGRILLSRPFRL